MLSAALCLATPAAHATTGEPTIVLLRDGRADERMLRRLHAELAEVDLRVIEVPSRADDSPRSVERAARRAGAFAAVRLVPSGLGVEVWIADRVTGKTVLREVVVAPGQDADEVVALRAVELLRASLIEVQMPHPSRGEVQPPEAIRRVLPEPRASADRIRAFRLFVGPALSVSPGGIGPTLHAQIGIELALAERIGIGGWVLAPVFAATLRGPEGSAEVTPWLAGAGAYFDILPQPSPWLARGGAGMGVLHLRVSGDADPPFRGHTDGITAVAPFLSARISYEIARAIRLGTDLLGARALERPVVGFAGREAAHFGRPVAAIGLTLEIEAP